MIENLKPIDDELGVLLQQPTPEQLHQAAREGFKSVINLRAPDEEGALSDEGQQAEAAGLGYVNIPVKPEALSDELADQVLRHIAQAPKPVLVHCKTGLRSGALALMYAAVQEGWSAAEAMERGRRLGLSLDAMPRMKQFFEQYVSTHSKAG
jgi:uncharacterized protein (TIGR01244 family)